MVRLIRKLSILLRREKFHREMEEEMAFHRELAEEELAADGVSLEEAPHAARRRFGNDLRLKEQSHEVVGFRFESVLQDLRFALRQLRKNPGFAVTAILVLALGIAASVAIFAFVDAALIQPLPYENPSRLVSVYESSCAECGLSYANYVDWKRDNKVFSSLQVWEPTAYLLRSRAGVQALRAGRVSGGFFHTLGVAPMLGRGFTDADDTPSAPRTALLPYGTWQRQFGGRQDIIGQSVVLDDLSYTVIGVLPRDFYFPLRAAELWVTIHDPDSCDKDRSCRDYSGLARLKDGVSVQTALADSKTIAAQLEREYPDSNKEMGAQVVPLRDDMVGDIRPILLVLLSGAGLLLLIACVNVASLLLVRAENRKREMALRGALGASLGRLLRLFVTEGVVLVMCSASLGLAAADVTIHLLFALIPERVLRGMPYFHGIGLHPRVLLFAGAVSLFAMMVFTVTPALRLSVSNLREDLAEGGRSAAGGTWKRFGSNLVAVELAVAMVLLACAGLMGKSAYRLFHVDLNFHPEHLATLEIDANTGYGKVEQQVALSRQLTERIAAMPGVISAGEIRSHLPVSCNCDATEFRTMGHPWNGEHNDALERAISVEYFSTIQARLMRGRFFTEADDMSKSPVVIINQAFAKRFFPDEDPVGKIIGDEALSPKSLRQIVGVVDDIREGGLDEEIRPAMYRPFNLALSGYFFVVVRTAQDPAAMLPSIVGAIHQLDPNVGVRNEITMTEHINDMLTAYLHRLSAWLVGGFAALALLLSVVGLYGVIAYSVSQRTREIGVRIALGAQRGSVYRLILGEAGSLVLVGIGVGLACSITAATLMRKLLFGVQAWDVSTLVAVAVLLGVCAFVASFLPARRAASVNPVEALRAE
jgi:predicted permease